MCVYMPSCLKTELQFVRLLWGPQTSFSSCETSNLPSTRNILSDPSGMIMQDWRQNVTCRPALSQARNHHEGVSKESSFSCLFLAWLILRPWRWRRHVPPKHRFTFNGLHGVISQKTELFNVTLCSANLAPSKANPYSPTLLNPHFDVLISNPLNVTVAKPSQVIPRLFAMFTRAPLGLCVIINSNIHVVNIIILVDNENIFYIRKTIFDSLSCKWIRDMLFLSFTARGC
jgi:hypothetical protein